MRVIWYRGLKKVGSVRPSQDRRLWRRLMYVYLCFWDDISLEPVESHLSAFNSAPVCVSGPDWNQTAPRRSASVKSTFPLARVASSTTYRCTGREQPLTTLYIPANVFFTLERGNFWYFVWLPSWCSRKSSGKREIQLNQWIKVS